MLSLGEIGGNKVYSAALKKRPALVAQQIVAVICRHYGRWLLVCKHSATNC